MRQLGLDLERAHRRLGRRGLKGGLLKDLRDPGLDLLLGGRQGRAMPRQPNLVALHGDLTRGGEQRQQPHEGTGGELLGEPAPDLFLGQSVFQRLLGVELRQAGQDLLP